MKILWNPSPLGVCRVPRKTLVKDINRKYPTFTIAFLGSLWVANTSHCMYQVPELSPRMDIFSLGCLIAELFTNGQVIFDLPRLLDYSNGKFSPDSTLELISDKEIQSLVRHMINVSPQHRHSASKYLDLCRGKVLPECFYSYLHHFLASFSASVDPPHLRIRQLHRDIDQVPAV